MKKILALISSLLLVATFATPAQSAPVKYSVYQKTLSTFSSSATGLTNQQKAQVKAAVEANPTAEKFICTGIRYYSQPMSVNIMVRKRAKAACEYAKQLNPDLSTWFQNKPTQARSYAGKVLLTVKSSKAGAAWEQMDSPSPAAACKVEDGMSPALLAQGRGGWYQGQKARGPVGFPWVSAHFFPTQGEMNFLMLLVSFDDTRKFIVKPQDYWGPQAQKLSGWFDYWSQGDISIDIDSAETWIDLPYPSSEAPASDGQLARDIISRLPTGTNVNDYDALFIQWAPGIKAGTRDRFSLRLNGIDNKLATDGFENNFRQMVWSPDFEFYRNRYEERRSEVWGSLIHEILHEMNFNLHGPGNGWGTGVGQSYRPTQAGGVSYSITAWEQFLVGWMDDSQVHCVLPSDLQEEQRVILTPLEIYGGERRALVVPISNSDVLVVESRRPIGYSNWDSKNSGLLAYTVNPQELAQRDHIDEDCGNDPTHTKWAYYLFPDQEIQEASGWCGAMGGKFSPAVINVGETLSHNGVRVELVSSTAEKDFVKIKQVGPSELPPGGYPTLGPPIPGGGWWNDCDENCPLDLPNPAENFGYEMPTREKQIPTLKSCEDLSRWGLRNGIAGSRDFRDKAGAEVAIFVSTQWYAKNRALDTNLDGVLCSCQAPEVEGPSGSTPDDFSHCWGLQADQTFIAPSSRHSTREVSLGHLPDYPLTGKFVQELNYYQPGRLRGYNASCSCCCS